MSVETVKHREILNTLKNLEKMISWEPLQDRHIRGKCQRGYLWIRVGRDGKVSGLYTMFGDTVKYVPETEEEMGIEAMKIRAQIILENHDFAEKLAINNKR